MLYLDFAQPRNPPAGTGPASPLLAGPRLVGRSPPPRVLLILDLDLNLARWLLLQLPLRHPPVH